MKAAAIALGLLGCLSSEPTAVSGAARCDRPTSVAGATGCARIYGTVTSTRGIALDGIEGSVRPGPGCPCPLVTLQVDERGLFSGTIYRVGSMVDSAAATVVVQATDAKYPRHVTGAPFFDTLAVTLRFAATGVAPEPFEVRLRIPLP